jgi:macrolide transport system ATP-binding/permease protein
MSLYRRISNLFSRAKVEHEIDAELQAHIELRTDDNIAAGMSREAARRDAVMRFGNPAVVKERTTAADAALLLESIWADARFTLRQLIKNPGFAFTIIVVLALGVGASVAMFAFVDAALIRPLPYKNSAQLVSVYEVVQTCPLCNISYQNFRDWQKSDLPFQSLDAWGYSAYLLRSSEGMELAQGARVSDGFFRTLGVTPLLGRDFYPGEDAPGRPHAALISYASWQTRFGGRRDVIGETVMLSDIPYTIIGVLPQSFHFAPRGKAEFWAALNDPSGCDKRRGCHGLFGLARLREGATLQQAVAGMQTIAARLAQQYPDSNHGLSATATALSESIVGDVRPVLLLLLSGAVLLLLIACVNATGLLLVRTESRKRETAVRGALGATPARLLRQFLTEAGVLVAAGCATGLVLAYAAMKLLVSLVPADRLEGMPYLLQLGFTPHVVAFVGIVALLAAVVFTVMPALRGSFSSLQRDLSEGSRGSSGRGWQRLGSRLIAVEIAAAVVLLVGAGLLGKSLYRLLHIDLGFEPDHVATVIVSAPKFYDEGDRLMQLVRLLPARLDSLPGVTSAGIGSHMPVRAWDGGTPIVVPGRTMSGNRHDIPERDVSWRYMETMGARLLRGHFFSEAEDDAHKPQIAVVNHMLAEEYFPGENPIGKRLAYEGSKDSMEVVGEIADMKEGQLDTPNRPVIYRPFNQSASSEFLVMVRTGQDEKAMLPAIAAAIHQIDAELAVSYPNTMTEVVNESNSAYLHRASASLVGGFAAVALVLSLVGLYGVIAYSVSQRTREIGVRMALGAERSAVYRMVFREAGVLTVIGIGAGLICSMVAASLMRNLLFGTQAWDASTLLTVAALLGFSAMAACYLPARHAASVNPVEALRAE